MKPLTLSGDSTLAGDPPSTQHGVIRSASARPEQAGGGANPEWTWRDHARLRAQQRTIKRICVGLFLLIAVGSALASCAAAVATAQSTVQPRVWFPDIRAPRATNIGSCVYPDPCDGTEVQP